MRHITYNNFLYFLLFLYPLFSTVVRHWNSTLFGFIVLTGLVYFFRNKSKEHLVLEKYEKIFLWLLAGNFLVFSLTSLVHPPDRISGLRFDIELRFLLIIPVYFLLVRSKDAFKYLATGAGCSVLIAFLYALYDIIFQGEQSFGGVYSHLYTGPVNLIYLCIAFSFLYWVVDLKPGIRWALLGTIFIAGVYTIIYTYSRVTYFAFAVVIIFYALIMVRGWLRYLAIPALLLTVVFVGYTSPQVNSRMSHAYDELTEYITLSKSGERVTTEISSSVGTRLEMWRATPLILRDHAIIGVGNGNYNNIMQDYIENKELNPVVGRHSHAHNVFVNVLILKGILGFLITCAVLFFPLYVYIRTYKQSRETAATGIAFLVIIIMYSFNETAPFVKSNFVATFLLISAVLFQNHMHKIKNQ